MFSELPSIFDRNFVISFFLPLVIFVLASLGLFYGFELPIPISNEASPLQTTTLVGAGSLLGGVLLLVLNTEIYRILEGYPVESVRLLTALERRRFRRLQSEVAALREEQALSGEEMPPRHFVRQTVLMREAAERFPHSEEFVLPTSFGNIIRSFEVYSKVIYGIDAIPGWPRLQAVMNKDYHEIINEAKAITDFWMNMMVLSFIFLFEYMALAFYTGRLAKLWLPFLIIGLAALFYSRAKYAARGWGETVRAAFDIFLPDLRKKLGFPFPANMAEEREQWLRFSWVMIYHLDDIEFNRIDYSKAETSKGSGS